MVVLAPRFTLLAALASIAAVSALPAPAEGAVVQVRYRDQESNTVTATHHRSTHDVAHTASADASRSSDSTDKKDSKPEHHTQPVLALPSPKTDAVSGKRTSKHSSALKEAKDDGHDEKHEHDKEKRADLNFVHSVAQFDELWVGPPHGRFNMKVVSQPPTVNKRHRHDHGHDRIIVKGDHDHVNVRRSWHDHHDKVVVKGDDDHVHIHRSPRSHRHHGKVIVKRDYQHVNVRRSPVPEPHHHDHDEHDDHDKVIVKGDHNHVNVVRELPMSRPIYVVGSSDKPYFAALMRRDGSQAPGVPGSIDIMSQTANSTTGQKIASLVLSPADNSTDSSENSTTASFVLNASGTDQTQIYLVAWTSDSSNSTASGNSTSPSDSSNLNSTMVDPSFIKVRLQVLVFDAFAAQMDKYCATFDANPPAPSPMTVEPCRRDAEGTEHASQVFAYEPGTGVVRPLWYTDRDDVTGDSGTADPGDPSRSLNSTMVSTSTLASSSAMASATASASDRMASLQQESGDATVPPFRASFAKMFDAPAFAQAQNVTLVFTPAAPEVISEKTAQVPDDDDDDESDDGSDDNSSDSATSDPTGVTTSASGTASASTSTSVTSLPSVTTMSSAASSTATVSDTSSASNSTMPVFSASNIISAAKFASMTVSATSSDTSSPIGSVSASTDSASSSMSATAVPASLAVEVYDPAATASSSSSFSGNTSASISATPVSSSANGLSSVISTASASATGSTDMQDFVASLNMSTTNVPTNSSSMTASSTSLALTMTTSSAAPYEWMFHEGTIKEQRV
ncbi:uncharacterized protein LAESUDRAFT_764499 [Laetiporus sulphureus 93-53]|uniref:Uncharacterized protein n=1 Tax=Laetiporus sulphureus 93-53 TaxID=1314785 RepID=A0A165B9X7_9APHY|nr:uncharacterized protein LAESUDRAFT_764499 [Laetiporus sulphureus 93-53]KZT00588.1 hypothetical protein LAESUDRAFT_764499 [Laetiporus sulphureus 93-53]